VGDRKDAPDWKTFRQECERYLPTVVPDGLTLVIRRLQKRVGEGKPHNRYILTDLGGVMFGNSFDEGDPGETDDVALLSNHAYQRRLGEYAGSKLAFDLEGEVELVGS
jgi:hypothetical protein